MSRTTRKATMLKTVAVVTALLCGSALARPFIGVFTWGNYVTNTEADPLVVSLGAQAGVHNLLGLSGARGTVELSVYPDFALAGSFPDRTNYYSTEVAGDALFSTGLLGVTGYAGVAVESVGSSMPGRCRLGQSPGSSWPEALPNSGCRRTQAPCFSICRRGWSTTSASKGAVSLPQAPWQNLPVSPCRFPPAVRRVRNLLVVTRIP